MIYDIIDFLKKDIEATENNAIINFLKDCFFYEIDANDEMEDILDDYDITFDNSDLDYTLEEETIINNFKKILDKTFNIKKDYYNSLNNDLKDIVQFNTFRVYGFECVYVILKVKLTATDFRCALLKYDDLNDTNKYFKII